MIKHIFFDLDNTILDFDASERKALSTALLHFGITPTPEMLSKYNQINIAQWKLLEKGELDIEGVKLTRFQIFFEWLNMPLPAELPAYYEQCLGQGHFFMDGAQDLLNDLLGKYHLYLASNGIAKVQMGRLQSANLPRYFDKMFVSENVGYNKPDKRFFDVIFSSINDFNKEESVMVGDSLTSDIMGGINAGIKTIWLNKNNVENITSIIPTKEIHALCDLKNILLSL